MAIRVTALAMVAKSNHPAFCEGQECDESCECWIPHNGVFRVDVHCLHYQANAKIFEMFNKIVKTE